MSNLATVQNIYAAFGRGDIPAILDTLDDNIDWEYAYQNIPASVPWLQPRTGKAGVGAFFGTLSGMDFHQFVPKAFLEGPDMVVAIIAVEVTVKATGKRIVDPDEVHIWHFDPAGKVARFRHCVDTYQHVMACTG